MIWLVHYPPLTEIIIKKNFSLGSRIKILDFCMPNIFYNRMSVSTKLNSRHETILFTIYYFIQVIHQAVAVWTGETRPDSVLRKITDEEYKKKLEEFRNNNQVFNRVNHILMRTLFCLQNFCYFF